MAFPGVRDGLTVGVDCGVFVVTTVTMTTVTILREPNTMTTTNVREEADTGRGYVNADGSPRPFPFWHCVWIVVMSSVFFPVLFSGIPDRVLFQRAHLQRWTVVFFVGLLQVMRLLFAWVVITFAWTWLAWVVGLLLGVRVFKTANVWWPLIEGSPAPPQ